jgi:hypothetical protein
MSLAVALWASASNDLGRGADNSVNTNLRDIPECAPAGSDRLIYVHPDGNRPPRTHNRFVQPAAHIAASFTILKLPEVTRWRWVAVLSAASKCDGMIPAAEDLALILRITLRATRELLQTLETAKLIDKSAHGFVPHNWNGRQYKSDVSTDRVQKHRNKKRNGTETFHVVAPDVSATVTVTPPETEQIQKQSRRRNRPDQTMAEPAPAGKSLISVEAFDLSTKVIELMGLDPHHPFSVGGPFTVQCWMGGGWSRDVIITGVEKSMQGRQGDPPSTLKYFEKAIARAHAELTRVLPVVTIQPGEITVETARGPNRKTGGSIIDALGRQAAAIQRSIDDDNAPGRTDLLSLPDH